jgi:hypothetical protein
VPRVETAIRVLPANAPPSKLTHTSDRFSSITGESTPGDPADAGSSGGLGVSWRPAHCWGQLQPNDRSFGGWWSDTCQRWGEMVDDNRPDNRSYVHPLNATCSPNTNWVLRECGTGVGPCGDASKPRPLSERRGHPQRTATAPCRDVDLGVTVAGVSFGGMAAHSATGPSLADRAQLAGNIPGRSRTGALGMSRHSALSGITAHAAMDENGVEHPCLGLLRRCLIVMPLQQPAVTSVWTSG